MKKLNWYMLSNVTKMLSVFLPLLRLLRSAMTSVWPKVVSASSPALNSRDDELNVMADKNALQSWISSLKNWVEFDVEIKILGVSIFKFHWPPQESVSPETV